MSSIIYNLLGLNIYLTFVGGPGIPDPIEFSVVTFPKDRTVTRDVNSFEYFQFIAWGLDDPNISEFDKTANEEAEAAQQEEVNRDNSGPYQNLFTNQYYLHS